METKTEYDVALSVPKPSEIKVNGSSPTLAELKEYRDAWIQEARSIGKIDDLLGAAKILCTGMHGNKRYRHKWKGGEIELIYYLRSDLSPQAILYVEEVQGGKRLARIHETKIMKDIDFWVPGPWVSQIKFLAGHADKKMAEISKRKSKRDREELLS